MKAITLHPEWAFAVAHLGKRIENRTWKPPESLWLEPFAIHAGKYIGGRPSLESVTDGLAGLSITARAAGWDVEAGPGNAKAWMYHFHRGDELVHVGSHAYPMTTSAIVGVATLRSILGERVVSVGEPGVAGWKEVGRYGWHFDYQPLPEPIPCGGKQGLWTLPADIEARVKAAHPLPASAFPAGVGQR